MRLPDPKSMYAWASLVVAINQRGINSETDSRNEANLLTIRDLWRQSPWFLNSYGVDASPIDNPGITNGVIERYQPSPSSSGSLLDILRPNLNCVT